jgi:murein DD-endopeptidase MepM/ murein hydrolase activator NlpD
MDLICFLLELIKLTDSPPDFAKPSRDNHPMKLQRVVVIGGLISLQLAFFLQPASAAPTYVFPVADCAVSYGKYHHDYPATDIQAKKGCAFVAPIGGVVDEIVSKDMWSGKTNLGQDRGGLSVSIIGDDGVRYYGSHLSKIESTTVVGLRVIAGTKLGEVGSTGSAKGTAPHLHFGISWPTEKNIWWVRRGVLYPWKFLDAWKAGKDLSPAISINSVKLKMGELPPKPKK